MGVDRESVADAALLSLKGTAKRLAWGAAPRFYRRTLAREARGFSIGIATGDSPFALQWRTIANPVLTKEHVTDVPASFVADPFMCRDGDQWYLFFEVLNHLTRKGEIGLAVSRDAIAWKYQCIVLAEPFHLSYPYVFRWDGAHYMIPEGAVDNAVCLYRAAEFPYRWVREAKLLTGARYADASIFFHGDRWWLFVDAGRDVTNPVLRLFFADRPTGPWREHPSSPLRQGDRHFSRPAGRVVVVDGQPVRFTQDIYPTYGRSVSAFAITTLTPTAYEEQRVGDRPVLAAGSEPWNSGGMHHIDAHRREDRSWLACVDGF
jgi:hypothetical protein